jgi:hypothetical protein
MSISLFGKPDKFLHTAISLKIYLRCFQRVMKNQNTIRYAREEKSVLGYTMRISDLRLWRRRPGTGYRRARYINFFFLFWLLFCRIALECKNIIDNVGMYKYT